MRPMRGPTHWPAGARYACWRSTHGLDGHPLALDVVRPPGRVVLAAVHVSAGESRAHALDHRDHGGRHGALLALQRPLDGGDDALDTVQPFPHLTPVHASR